ncbi:MAG: hypothetical protein NC388_09370 [Clostridium sp.]|nr:hypothetical protein [Clostridium sp.]
MFFGFFALAILPIFSSLKRIYDRQGLNIFDVTLVFSALYFWAIPVKDFFVNHVRPEYIQHTPTAFAVCLYMCLLGVCAAIYSRKKKSPLYVTERLAEIKIMQIKDSFQWLALIYIAYMLFQITNYAALDDENIEGNNNFFYGTDANIIMKMILVPFRTFFPVVFIVLWSNIPAKSFYKQLRKINIVLIVVALLLGNKGFMMFNCTFLALYLYSIKRKQISRNQIILYVSAVIVALSFVFPLSQSFRYYKQDVVKHSSVHDFTTVLSGFIENGVSDDLKERVEAYEKGRSLNLYDAVDFAASRTEYRGWGHLTWIVLSYIIPQRMRNDGNIMAVMMQGGGDVGESILAWHVLDWGILIGPCMAVLHYLILYLLYYYIGIYFNRWIKSPVYPLVIYSFILRLAIGCEHNPNADIKAIYNTYYLIIIFAGIVLYYYRRKNVRV